MNHAEECYQRLVAVQQSRTPDENAQIIKELDRRQDQLRIRRKMPRAY